MENMLAKVCFNLTIAGGIVGAFKFFWMYAFVKGEEYKKQINKICIFIVFISAIPILVYLIPNVMGDLQNPVEKIFRSVVTGGANMIAEMSEF
jgi:hypothetical protein